MKPVRGFRKNPDFVLLLVTHGRACDLGRSRAHTRLWPLSREATARVELDSGLVDKSKKTSARFFLVLVCAGSACTCVGEQARLKVLQNVDGCVGFVGEICIAASSGFLIVYHWGCTCVGQTWESSATWWSLAGAPVEIL